MKDVVKRGARAAVRARRMAGYSLVEMAVALVVLGMVLTGLVTYWRWQAHHEVTQQVRTDMDEVNAALLAYVQANHRLPCPDTDGDGTEGAAGTCPVGAVVGRFPWKTVGVFGPAARDMRYGVYRKPNAADPRLDVDLTLSQDRFPPLVAQGVPLGADELLLGRRNLIDFCRALDIPARAAAAGSTAPAVEADRLSVWSPGQPASRRNVAYVLAHGGLADADGDGAKLDGSNATATDAAPAFELPTRAPSENYDDVVVAGTFEGLFAELDCGAGLSAIGHSHANAALTSAMLRQGIRDYRRQLQLLADAAGASVASATAGSLSAASGLSKAIATSLDATSVMLVSQGTAAAILAPAVAAIAANTAATVTAAASLAKAIAFKVEADQRYANVAPLVTLAENLAPSVDTNFRQADQAGY
jgi:type II secretory pathway pseudopilin PulG